MSKKMIVGLVCSSILVQAVLFTLLYQFVQMLGNL